MTEWTIERLAKEMAAVESNACHFPDAFAPLFDSFTGIGIGPADENDAYDDEFLSQAYRVDLFPNAGISDWGYTGRPAVGGRGDYAIDAKRSAMFEAIERYSLSMVEESALITATYLELHYRGELALDPQILMDGNADRDKVTATRQARMRWISADSLLHGKKIFIPAQIVYLPYIFLEDEPVLRDPLTTGAASGLSRGKATLRGLLEVIERDSTMLCHYSQGPTWRIDKALKRDTRMQMVFDEADRLHFDLRFFDVSADHNVFVVSCGIRDLSRAGAAVIFCSKASFDWVDAAKGAFLEASCFHRAQREHLLHLRLRGEELWKRPFDIDSAEDRGAFIVNERMLDSVRPFWDSPHAFERSSSPLEQTPATMENLLRDCMQKGGDIIIADVTSSDIRSFGCHVVKTIVPCFQPMHIRERDRNFSARLRQISKLPPELCSPHPYI